MRNLILGSALALAATSAMAADVGTKPMATYAPAPLAANFTGFYAGVNVGGAFADATTVNTTGGVPPGPYNFTPKGVMGGGQIGANYQMQNIVIGVELDVGYINATSDKGYVPSSNPAYHQDLTLSGGWYGDVTGRIGYAFGNLLVYGKGGYGYVDVSAKQQTTKPGYSATGTGAYSGAVFGGGAEYLLSPNWSVKAEFLRFDLGGGVGKQTSLTDPPIGYQYLNATDLRIDTVKVGLNYRF